MRATSAAQERATAHNELPALEQVREGVWALATPMPGGQRRLGYTLTYLLLDAEGRVHVVDPGWDLEANWQGLCSALEQVAPHGDVASIIVTHLHPDHLGMAPRLRQASGAALVLHEREAAAVAAGPPVALIAPAAWGVPAQRHEEFSFLTRAEHEHHVVVPDLSVRGAVDHLHPPGLDIEVLHTPGHTVGHICLRLPAHKLLLTGDHVLPALYPGLGLGGFGDGSNPIADNFASLAALVPFEDHEVLPGHHYRFTGLGERIATIEGHHRRRSAEVAHALGADPAASVYDIAAALTWSAGWARLQGGLLYSALLQTSFHIDFLRRDGAPTPSTSRSIP